MQFIASIVNGILDAYIFILLIRLILQKFQASWHNPMTQFVVKLTDPIVKPVRRVIPGFKGFDLSILFIAFAIELLEIYLVTWLRLGFTAKISGVLLVSVLSLLIKTTYIFLFATIIWSFLSWFTTSQRHPLSEIAGIISYPMVRLTRRFLPAIGGIDLSPVVVIFVFYLMINALWTPLLRYGFHLALL